MVSVGTIIWLSSELMFFAALFASYFTIRAVSPDLWASNTEKLNVPFASVNTTILVLSSLTCQLGVFAAERGQVGRSGKLFQFKAWGLREWFVLTYLMGAVFIGGQAGAEGDGATDGPAVAAPVQHAQPDEVEPGRPDGHDEGQRRQRPLGHETAETEPREVDRGLERDVEHGSQHPVNNMTPNKRGSGWPPRAVKT
jgi:hypothetical protein